MTARRRAETMLTGAVVAADAYLLMLLGAAALRRPAPPQQDGRAQTRLLVLIPAHNEESGVAETVVSVLDCDYPTSLRQVVVVADNCTDATAEVAATAGAAVWERVDGTRRGKGHALAWAIERAGAEHPDVDAIVVVDADCLVSTNLLATVDAHLADGARIIQVRDEVANPDESATAALRWAGFALINTVRAAGRDRLGFSAGLFGTGMAFRSEVLAAHGWNSSSLAEDAELHHRLVAAGERVVFADAASVRSAMPTDFRSSREQHMRWEGGRWHLMRLSVPRLLRTAASRRNPAALMAAVELLLVPPQSLLALGNVVAVATALVSRRERTVAAAMAGAAAQAAFVVGGLAYARAPASVWRALAHAPTLVAWKLWLQVRALVRPPDQWVRTSRIDSG